MKVIISGGSGLIGRPLTVDLAEDGHEVIILSRSPDRIAGRLPRGAQAAEWDGRTASGWAELVNGADAVINLAGENIAGDSFPPERWTKAKKERILQSRLDASKAVVEALRQADQKPAVLIQASAVGYYGPRGDEPVVESDPPGDDFLAGVCAQWEAATDSVEELGMRQAIIRTGLVLSDEGGPLPSAMLPFKFGAGGRLGGGRQYWPWIHIADQVRAIRFLLEKETARGPFNLTAPNPVTNAEFSKILGRVMGRPALIPAPAFALRLALGEMSTMLLDGQRAIPQRLAELGFVFRFDMLEAALKDLLK